jgi:4-amino-4-deoxy-L-arabinose transferase-like glycosyltransferase
MATVQATINAVRECDPDDAPTVGPASTLMSPGARERAALIGVIVLAAGLRLVWLDQNEYGNSYYSAAVRSMLASGKNLFFGSFDPLGIVTVDKPPVALWIQTISARLLGFSGFSLLLPQALMGVASVWLIYHLVRRVFGGTAGLLAGLILAITPIGVAMDRDNLPDPALVLVLLLAAWAFTRAAETGRLRPLLLSTALAGIGFQIKMLAAFVVLPTFYLVYMLAAPVGRRTRFAHLAAATAVLVASSLAWPIAVELTPKGQRPYIGGSRNNSALELALGYNGVARIMGMGGFGPGGPRPGADSGPPAKGDAADAREPTKPALPAEPDDPDADAFAPPPPPGGPGAGFPPFPGGPGGMPGFGGRPGFLRFANASMAGQITWLFPLAIVGAAVAAARAPRSWPIGPEHVALLLWSGWFGTHWFVFSFAQGIFHDYYTYIMGPAVAAMAGVGIVALWDGSRIGGWRRLLLPATILLTAAWQTFLLSRYPDWSRWLLPILLGAAGTGSLMLLAARWLAARRGSIPWAQIAAATGLGALLIGPSVWSLTPVLARGNSMLPTADPSLLTGKGPGGGAMFPGPPPMGMEPREAKKLLDLLHANRHGERILLAAPASMEVSSIITETGEPVISLGGFMGADRVFTREQFAELVASGQVRFVLIGGGPGGGGPPPGGMPGGPGGPRGGFGPSGGFGPPGGGPPGMGNAELMAWVREHGKVVDPDLWKVDEPPASPEASGRDGTRAPEGFGPPPNPAAMFARMRRLSKLYDCRPELGLVTPTTR